MEQKMVIYSFTSKKIIMKRAISKDEWDEKIENRKKQFYEKSVHLSQEDSAKAGKNDFNEYEDKLKRCYRRYHDLEKEIEKPENVWEVYEAEDFDRKQIESFEYFFCGYIQYYDYVNRNGCIDHVLHFNWKKVPGKVVVYICPKPLRAYDPDECPSPSGFSSGSDPTAPKPPPPPYP